MLLPTINISNSKIRPLIKWTGGKYDEFNEFAHLIPPYNNYYEPFFGGGGVFFALQPQGLSFLNDKSADLIKLYKLIGNGEFKDQLYEYADAWDMATALSKQVCEELVGPFQQYLSDEIDRPALKHVITTYINGLNEDQYKPLFSKPFILYPEAFKNALNDSLADKFNRIKNIQKKEERQFTLAELFQHIETGVKSGLYLFLRGNTNKQFTGNHHLNDEKATANWYFVREFCYASMFRFNRKGEFNIPYGGIAYNSKNFRNKVDLIFSAATTGIFKNAFFYNLDFEAFFGEVNPGPDDFVFLDPPYDSEFSEYDQNSFTRDDQTRLRNAIAICKSKCMLVIKETEFIRQLYSDKPFTIVDFDKSYTYNVRGRNNRDTKHLIILNYSAR